MKKILASMLLLASPMAAQAVTTDEANPHRPELYLNVNCKSPSGYHIDILPLSKGHRIEVVLKFKEGQILDDNLYTLTKSVFLRGHDAVIAEDIPSGVRIEVWDTQMENEKAIRVLYRNNSLKIDEYFTSCQIVNDIPSI